VRNFLLKFIFKAKEGGMSKERSRKAGNTRLFKKLKNPQGRFIKVEKEEQRFTKDTEVATKEDSLGEKKEKTIQ
jgi:hypothetical protein